MTDQSVTDESVTDESVTDESVTKPSALAKARIDRAVDGFQQILDEGFLARPDFGLDGHAGKHRIAAGGDTLTGGAGDGTIDGGAGDDLLTFQSGGGTDSFDGGAGWDTIGLDGVSTGPGQGEWTLQRDTGSIDSQTTGQLTLTGNPAGTITLADGSEITFQGVEEIQW